MTHLTERWLKCQVHFFPFCAWSAIILSGKLQIIVITYHRNWLSLKPDIDEIFTWPIWYYPPNYEIGWDICPNLQHSSGSISQLIPSSHWYRQQDQYVSVDIMKQMSSAKLGHTYSPSPHADIVPVPWFQRHFSLPLRGQWKTKYQKSPSPTHSMGPME